ncbi:hypothetical protein ACLD43_15250 [Clostridium botulinum]|uniref:hypothetical protein n=1 Tax=Clostridium botulinum TaxID=1491 RepID=UPI003A804913
MATLFFYEKSPEISVFDIPYFKDNKLDFEKLIGLLKTNKAGYNGNKIYNKEGYTQIKLNDSKCILNCAYIFKNTLGQYTEIKYDEEKKGLIVNRQAYEYYGRCRMSITDNLNIIIKASYSNEETSRGKCLSIFSEKGIDLKQIKLTNEVFQHIRNNYEWKRIKIQKIENEGDSTKSVSYEIDPASDKQSEVDTLYKDRGIFDSITFNIAFKEDKHVVRFYKDRSKISIDESQFKTVEELDNFCIHLLNLILRIKEGKEGNSGYCEDAESIIEEE